MRWTPPLPVPTSVDSGDSSAVDCVFCDDDPEWIELRDFAPMPTPAWVRHCDRCGMATATAVFPITSRNWGDAIVEGTSRRPALLE